jgi:quinol monooxygenase YgiN
VIVISGVMELAAESVETFTTLSQALCVATREEPGCAAYTFAVDIEAPGTFRISEEWADQDALDAHTKTDHYRTWGRALRDLTVVRTSIVRYDVSERAVLV